MQMTEFEIVADFKSAANKNKQIGILSDLNNCKPEDIMEILARHGAITGVKKKEPEKKEADKPKREKSTKWTPELDAEVSRLASEGLKITEIAERLGISVQAIYDRQRRFMKSTGESLYNKGKKEKFVKEAAENIEKGTEKLMNNVMTKEMPDIRDVAKNLADVFDVMGYGLSTFSFDVLSGTINIVAKEKTAGAATPTVKEM